MTDGRTTPADETAQDFLHGAGPMADATRMQCMEVWGGSGATNAAVTMTGVDVYVYGRPFGGSKAGGDVHYLSSCSSGRITRMLLADISGHGETVASMAESLRGLMRRHINHIRQTRLVTAMNEEFTSVSASGGYATALVSTFFAPTSTLALCNAGHPPPLLYRKDTGTWSALELGGSVPGEIKNIPLGLMDARYEQYEIGLTTGDLLLCFTDGLIESHDERGEALGTRGLLDVVKRVDVSTPERVVPQLVTRLAAMDPRNLTEDDVTVLLLRPNGAPVPLRNDLLAPFRLVGGWLGVYRDA